MSYTRAQRSLGACCSACTGSGMGDVNVATGVDATVRPGESWSEYIGRLGREQADYIKFAQQQNTAVSAPLLPPKEPAQASSPSMSNGKKLMLVGGIALGLFFLTRRRR